MEFTKERYFWELGSWKHKILDLRLSQLEGHHVFNDQKPAIGCTRESIIEPFYSKGGLNFVLQKHYWDFWLRIRLRLILLPHFPFKQITKSFILLNEFSISINDFSICAHAQYTGVFNSFYLSFLNIHSFSSSSYHHYRVLHEQLR